MKPSFYDHVWQKVCEKYPEAARKIEELRCECVSFEQYSREVKDLKKSIQTLAKAHLCLLELWVTEHDEKKKLPELRSTT